MKRGLTLVELIVAIAISLILSTAMYLAFKYSAEFFVQSRNVSDLVELARTTEIQLSYYFNRWGVGVPEDAEDTSDCNYTFNTNLSDTDFPANKYCINITSGVCDEIEFYGNIGGFIVILSELNPFRYNAYACIIGENTEDEYYYVWRENNVIALTTGVNLNLSGGEGCGLEGNISNATIPRQIEDINGNIIDLNLGDSIIRIPKIIRIYCSTYNGQNYLYVSEQEGDNSPIAFPLAPVESMSATLIPEGCQPNEGSCKGVVLDITFSKDGETLNKTILLAR